MGMILKSEKTGYIFKISDGYAFLEIEGQTHHLNRPYLHVRYLEGVNPDKRKVKQKKGERIFAGYEIKGLVFGWVETEITTNKLLQVLHDLGFFISSNQLREGITKNLKEEVNRLKVGA